jgi:hypothetical protein
LTATASTPYTYAAPWGGFGAPGQIFVLARGNCGDIPASQANGFHWPVYLNTLAAGTPVVIAGTPTFDNSWSVQNGCPTGGIVATSVTLASAPSPSPSPSVSPEGLVPPPGAIYLGARVNPDPAVYPYVQTRVATLEAQIGRRLALDDHYYTWTDTFPGADEADDYAHGRVPVIAWNCGYSNASVAAGAHDADIIAAATRIKAYGHRVMLRWFWEMDLTMNDDGRTQCWDPATDLAGGRFNPTYYVAAWSHIHAIFAAQSVANVIWLWNPSDINANNLAALERYYPGDAETNWVGFDSYALAPGETFEQTIGPMYGELGTITKKPVLVAESATLSSNQVAWLNGAATTLAANYPRIKGFMYFDAPGQRGDWSLSTSGSPDGIDMFTALAKSAYLGAMPAQP